MFSTNCVWCKGRARLRQPLAGGLHTIFNVLHRRRPAECRRRRFSTRSSRAVVGVWLAAAIPYSPAHEFDVPPWQAASRWPDRVVSTVTADPTSGFAVTWRTDATVASSVAQITVASADARFDISAETRDAKTMRLAVDPLATSAGVALRPMNHAIGPVHYHHVRFDGLQPGTRYAWRVSGAPGAWSEWFQTRTAPREGPISFVYMGDAQQGIRSHWTRVMRNAYETAPDAAFVLHAGDLVHKGDSDRLWAEWFSGGGYLHARIPSAPVVGNHEYIPVGEPGSDQKSRVLTPFWRAQFTLPIVEELPQALHEAVYDFRFSRSAARVRIEFGTFRLCGTGRMARPATRRKPRALESRIHAPPVFHPATFQTLG